MFKPDWSMVSVIISVLFTILGGAAWLTKLHSMITQTRDEFKQLELDLARLNDRFTQSLALFAEIRERLVKIETILEEKRRNQ